MNDEEIITLFWNRDETAISKTKQKYGKTLEALAYRMLRNVQDAEECCNDTYLELWNAIPPNRPLRFKAFAMRILRCNAINRIDWKTAQKRNCIQVELTREMEETIPDGKLSASCSSEELGKYLNKYLHSLPAIKRALFIRRYWYGDSIRELAQSFDMSKSNVKTSLCRIRNGLKEYLSKEGLM